jgi:hypothetical protein
MAIDPVPSPAAPPAWPWWGPGYDPLACGLASRTRKRHRDNRPDEETVHRTFYNPPATSRSVFSSRARFGVCLYADKLGAGSTIARLFDAQRDVTMRYDGSEAAVSVTVPSPPASRPEPMLQTTLHSFWNISQPEESMVMMTGNGPAFPPAGSADEPRCRECEGQIVPPGLADDGVRLQFMLGDCTCRGCSRVVCDLCAVGVAETRLCLQCTC